MRRLVCILLSLPVLLLFSALTVCVGAAAAEADKQELIRACASMGWSLSEPEGRAAYREIRALLSGADGNTLEGGEADGIVPYLGNCRQVHYIHLDAGSIYGRYLTEDGMSVTFDSEAGEMTFLSLYDEARDRYVSIDPISGDVHYYEHFRRGTQYSMPAWTEALIRGVYGKGGYEAVEKLPGISVERQSNGAVAIYGTDTGEAP